MRFKSTYLLFILVASQFLTSCYQDLVERNYSSSTPGYASPLTEKKNPRKRSNQFVDTNSRFRSQDPNNVPVIVNDPFAAGVNAPVLSSNSINSYNRMPVNRNMPQQQTGPYGSLSNAENPMIRGNILIQNNSPIYPQPSFGSNIYSPVRRQ
jgi:hypothetical protein